MKALNIKNILIPTDFSKTGLLAVEHAAFMARLCKADLYLLHAIEISATTFSVYEPAIIVNDNGEVERIAEKELKTLAEKLEKKYAITVKTLCSTGKVSTEIVTAVEDYSIDIVIMGTHGASGFNEFFMGSNAHKTVTICPCPVITVQAEAKKLGFKNIVLPIDDSFHSREKVRNAMVIAKKYASKIHILGLLDKDTEPKKFKVKIDSVEKALQKAGILYTYKAVKGDNLAIAAMKYSKKIKADLIVILTDNESSLTGIFLGAFAKQIVNHSKIPVMSMRPAEGVNTTLSFAGLSH